MNYVIFTCAKTGRAFNSGLHADPDDLRFVPPQWKTWLPCGVCCRVHEFKFVGARVGECSHNCRRNGDCYLCEFARQGNRCHSAPLSVKKVIYLDLRVQQARGFIFLTVLPITPDFIVNLID